VNAPRLDFWFDFVDPLSWLLACELEPMEAEGLLIVRWLPRELRPPPTPLTSVDDPELAGRWARARAIHGAKEPAFSPPRLVPWTRKAHELVLHAEEHDRAGPVRLRVFEAYLLEGRDIGRVDVLVDIARAEGLDHSNAKAVLDVDRHEATVAAFHGAAAEAGIGAPPTLALDDRRLEGFHNGAAVRTFLGT
jgi:predicted DsbA family dithiol-disulfide isomerase